MWGNDRVALRHIYTIWLLKLSAWNLQWNRWRFFKTQLCIENHMINCLKKKVGVICMVIAQTIRNWFRRKSIRAPGHKIIARWKIKRLQLNVWLKLVIGDSTSCRCREHSYIGQDRTSQYRLRDSFAIIWFEQERGGTIGAVTLSQRCIMSVPQPGQAACMRRSSR